MMKRTKAISTTALAAAISALVSGNAIATEPCGDFGECKALIEINASDGDVGFHFLMDGDDLNSARINDPNGTKVFEDQAKGPLLEQKLTETFAESAEPLCWPDPDADPEDLEDIVTLAEFLDIWAAGTYTFTGMGDGGEKSEGETELTYNLPAAPKDVYFNGYYISWIAGDDLGNCAPVEQEVEGQLILADVSPGIIPDPAGVPVAAFEVVMEPDVDDGDPTGNLVYSVRVPGTTFAVDVPYYYLASLPANTPVKIEVGAIGEDDNATFTEEDGFCVNEEDEGCEEEE